MQADATPSSGYPRERCIHELFEAQAATRPDAVALVHGPDQVSYAELNARANRLARHLVTLGVVPDERVGICVQRGVGMVVGLLAILKAGGAYLPLDPSCAPDRLSAICRDGAPRAVLIDPGVREDVRRHVRSALVAAAVTHTAIDTRDDAHLWAWRPASNLHPRELGLEPRHLAYVVHLFDADGASKGVMVEHRGVVNQLWSMRELLDIRHGDRVLALTELTIDRAALELQLPLVCGAQILMADEAHALRPDLLAGLIADESATLAQAPPATWRGLLDSAWEGSTRLQVLTGGEALPGELARRLSQRVARLWSLYGPAEATIWSSAAMVDDPPVGPVRRFEPIGRPIANARIYVLDAQCQPVPNGTPGELFIGGDGVARGYLNRPGMSAERFIADPFSAVPGARMFRTGDLACRREDGTLDVIGQQAAPHSAPYGFS